MFLLSLQWEIISLEAFRGPLFALRFPLIPSKQPGMVALFSDGKSSLIAALVVSTMVSDATQYDDKCSDSSTDSRGFLHLNSDVCDVKCDFVIPVINISKKCMFCYHKLSVMFP